MKNTIFLMLLLFLSISISCNPGTTQEEQQQEDTKLNPLLSLANEKARLAYHLHGGALVEFQLLEQKLNPFTWAISPENMPANNQKGAPFRGHFLCLGRWGSPSAGEIAAGVPHNGEQSNTWWQATADGYRLRMDNQAPLDGLTVSRVVSLQEDEAIFHVTETVKNVTALGRLSNFVQHPTIAAPFLTDETLVDTNAGKGFLQQMAFPNPYAYAFDWPNGFADTLRTPLNLRSSAEEVNYCTTHIFPEETPLGWVTAATASKELLLGYVWKTADYPWLNVWHHIEDGQPKAKGLEFGTTGIGLPYEQLLSVDTRFHGRSSFEYIDAGQAITKSYACFLLKIPADFRGVADVSVADGLLMVKELGENGRAFSMPFRATW